ncbi:hypothetical protein [Promicromonospora iranensis]|uniref:Uncharacterized protein n=1 Tax=Promicromonospora iranensis TaxID=1105144 RepID=A0ABU2CIU2_9MICO|nr:hypothetical protein [Promicromonospora iranensis]MDR7381250.1 hypothetical protein [Promicromonospora iranensis]
MLKLMIVKAVLPLAVAGTSLSPMNSVAEEEPVSTMSITSSDVKLELPAEEEALWNELTAEQQARSLEILNDEDFLTPAFDLAANPEVETSLKEGGDPVSGPSDVGALATRTRYVEQDWKIFGIAYTRIYTRMTFTTNGASVTSIQNCWNTHVNYVPFRSIDSSSYSGRTGANAPSGWCKTDWALTTPLQDTRFGTQGLLCNGYGTIVTRWNV